jgi:UDP-N-acetylmuramate: L-alanyl-gamma-D-glutamyl-meso-diaminopimelate ligase
MLLSALEGCGFEPGFMIGGVVQSKNSGFSSGSPPWFVIEGDEYDTAFFDKGPKFLHYRPHGLILTSIEFDHADIFRDFTQVVSAFEKVVDITGTDGVIAACNEWDAVRSVCGQARCRVVWYGEKVHGLGPVEWYFDSLDVSSGATSFIARSTDGTSLDVRIRQPGRHNALNALGVIALSSALGLDLSGVIAGLGKCRGVRRRQEVRGVVNGITVIDDFAHHPTAITATLDALRQKHPQQCLMVVLEARSNTMKLGHHLGQLGQALSAADRVIIWRRPDLTWEPAELAIPNDSTTLEVCNSVEDILGLVHTTTRPGDQIVLMSNGDFDGLAARLINQLSVAH